LIRLVALSTAPGAARRAPVRNRAPRARTGVLQYPGYVQFQARVPQMESSTRHALRPLLAPPRLAVVGPRQERKGERRCWGSRERKMAGHRTAPGRRGAGAAASRGRRERSHGRALGSATAPAREELRHLLRLRRSQGRRGAGSGSCRAGRRSCSRRRRGLAGEGLVPPVEVVCRAQGRTKA
jgi:hypothetical protein